MIHSLLLKTAQFITFLSQTSNKMIIQNILKNIQIIIFNLSTIQSLFPLLFHENLNDYLQLPFILLENDLFISSENIIKSGLLSLLKVLKSFAYYSDTETFVTSFHSNAKLQNFQDIQKECATKFYSFFSESNVEKLVNLIIMRILPFCIFSKEEDQDNLVENGSFFRIINMNFFF